MLTNLSIIAIAIAEDYSTREGLFGIETHSLARKAAAPLLLFRYGIVLQELVFCSDFFYPDHESTVLKFLSSTIS